MSSLSATPNANRLHIAFFGKRNAGKSTLINALTGQNVSLVSDTAGTTTDPVFKAIELNPLGPCIFIDTAGFDDFGELGKMRVEKTFEILDKTDVAVMVIADGDFSYEEKWIKTLKERNIPLIPVINKTDIIDFEEIGRKFEDNFGLKPVFACGEKKENTGSIIEAIVDNIPEDFEKDSITARLVRENDLVLLVMPQDIQAPKGRLILPQVQTIRDLLDNKCIILSVTADKFSSGLEKLNKAPDLIITDSQIFDFVYENKPPQSRLTSFSVLFATYKGDPEEYIRGAEKVDSLDENSKILIAESCSHKPLKEDIGRVKIPRMLKKRFGENISIDIVGGNDFPRDLTGYDLVIQCGGCMFNRKHILSRIQKAKQQNVPITNYGIFIAKMNNILDKITK